MTHSAKRDYDLAIADYDKAIDLNPKYAFPYRGRAASYTEKRDYDRAAANIDKAIELNPKDAAAYNGLARTYFKAGKAATGLPDWKSRWSCVQTMQRHSIPGEVSSKCWAGAKKQ